MEFISVFDIFKIGVGPSSSHTMGPWRAAQAFLREIEAAGKTASVRSLTVKLYGSLAKTGRGHGTDMAILMGLSGEDPVTIDVNSIAGKMRSIRELSQIQIFPGQIVPFDPSKDIIFLSDQSLPFHSNAMQFDATFADNSVMKSIYYSVGGGFIVRDGTELSEKSSANVPYPINSGEDLLAATSRTGLAISQVVLTNEKSLRKEADTHAGLRTIWETMLSCIYRGCHTDGELPGGLKVKRRAFAMNQKLLAGKPCPSISSWTEAIQQSTKSFQDMLNWVSCFALAVNEENASYGRVVTAPTNGAAGVIPAVMGYYRFLCPGTTDEALVPFLLTAGELGSIFKKGSTISAAMGGCQAEIGVSSAMAAGALTECLGGSPEQVLMAAEIAMEHHLGMTCDPIGGLVQIPCIERNTMGAIKAITASQIALHGDPKAAKVSLDAVIKTMWQTAKDMNHKYKETSEGGLATHVSVGLAEC